MLANSPILPVLLAVPMAIALTLSGQLHSDPTTPFIYLVLANLKPYHLGRSLKNSTIVCTYFSIIRQPTSTSISSSA
ncbi:hypothetical protein PPACK8108_LOCUS21523 [Phakopsora pachyrhizi]|uniref:Secreted protein n=1 Tax=Phakopsora pachyrhizi TaxID=170000 RepID=A0AAV0BIQ1_PHAPC|nr:hypothetical protein PPACK8108_LOCUS21523 [Phakopsora pachyrhizi]